MSNSFDKIILGLSEISKERQRLSSINKLMDQNKELNSHCGSCRYWMTKKCKYESSSNKISSNHGKCFDFSMQEIYKGLIQKNLERIKSLKSIN